MATLIHASGSEQTISTPPQTVNSSVPGSGITIHSSETATMPSGSVSGSPETELTMMGPVSGAPETGPSVQQSAVQNVPQPATQHAMPTEVIAVPSSSSEDLIDLSDTHSVRIEPVTHAIHLSVQASPDTAASRLDEPAVPSFTFVELEPQAHAFDAAEDNHVPHYNMNTGTTPVTTARSAPLQPTIAYHEAAPTERPLPASSWPRIPPLDFNMLTYNSPTSYHVAQPSPDSTRSASSAALAHLQQLRMRDQELIIALQRQLLAQQSRHSSRDSSRMHTSRMSLDNVPTPVLSGIGATREFAGRPHIHGTPERATAMEFRPTSNDELVNASLCQCCQCYIIQPVRP